MVLERLSDCILKFFLCLIKDGSFEGSEVSNSFGRAEFSVVCFCKDRIRIMVIIC